jgi:hypothetical protein
MARLRNIKSGAVVSVTDEKAVRLGAEWEPADKPAPKAPAKKAAHRKTASDDN